MKRICLIYPYSGLNINSMNDIICDYLDALDERANQVCGLNQGQQYITGFLCGTLKDLKLQEHELDILKRDTKRLKQIIESENK